MPCQPRPDLPGVARHLRGKYTLTLYKRIGIDLSRGERVFCRPADALCAGR